MGEPLRASICRRSLWCARFQVSGCLRSLRSSSATSPITGYYEPVYWLQPQPAKTPVPVCVLTWYRRKASA